jgi:1-acyl-sn-glycerol-3-phosphate acyltransferase
MKKQIYKLIFFRLMGWKIVGTIESDIKKCVIAMAPHTSWHDFYLGIFTRGITQIEINWVGKKELFNFPFGKYFKYMGGAPLDRTGGLNKVDAIAEVFKKKEVFRLAIAPEGTRKKVSEFKTGFYYIALKAQVPIITVGMDYGNKVIRFGKPFFPTGNIEEDIALICQDFKGVKGKIAANSFEVN